MSTVELSELVRRLTRRSTRALERGLDRCMKRQHYEVHSEHFFLGLLDDEGSDFMLLVRHYQLDLGRLRFVAERGLDDLRSGNAGNPTFGRSLRTWLEDASIEGAQRFSYPRIRSATLFLLLVRDPERYFSVPFGGLLAPVPALDLAKTLVRVAAGSNEEVEAPAVKERPIVPETSSPTFRREPVAPRVTVAMSAPEPAPPPAPSPGVGSPSVEAKAPALADEGASRAVLEARVQALEAALARAEQRIVTLAEAQTRADAAIGELTRTVSELVASALGRQGEPPP
jgi:hypothetical protein